MNDGGADVRAGGKLCAVREPRAKRREMQRYWVGTSWKMHKTLAEGLAFAEALAGFMPGVHERIQPFVIPSFTSVREVKRALASTRVKFLATTPLPNPIPLR